MRWPIALLALISVASADTVMLKNGLSVHGKVVETKDAVEVSSNGRTWRFDRAKVREIRLGESLPEEYARRKGELGASDAETAPDGASDAEAGTACGNAVAEGSCDGPDVCDGSGACDPAHGEPNI